MPIQLPNFALTGDFTSVVIHDQPINPPTNVLEAGQPWHLHIAWELKGPNYEMIAGTWHLHVNLESMGPGPELSLFDFIVPPGSLTLPSATGDYSQVFEVPGNEIMNAYNAWYQKENGAPPPAGEPFPHQGLAMKLVVLLQYFNTLGRADDIAGFYEGPIIMFFPPTP